MFISWYECVYISLIICHFKLNWFILLFFIAIRCSMCLVSFILLISISIDGIVFKHLQAYRYCLVMMNIRLNKSWYWKLVIPNTGNCSFSLNWIYIPVSVCNFTNDLFQMSWLCLHFTNKCKILSGSSYQNVQRSACIIFHLNKWVLVIISPVSEGSGDVMVLRRSRPSPAARHPPPATRRPQWC